MGDDRGLAAQRLAAVDEDGVVGDEGREGARSRAAIVAANAVSAARRLSGRADGASAPRCDRAAGARRRGGGAR
jgi:hypothetical protein